MSTDSILTQIDEEIARLKQVRTLLAATGKATASPADAKTKASGTKTRKRRVLSPEARKRIADAQRRRWAAQKAKSK